MNGAQITMIILGVFQLLVMSILDGEEKKGVHKFSMSLTSLILYNAILY